MKILLYRPSGRSQAAWDGFHLLDRETGETSTVIASAGGVVQTAEFHPQYGNLIEIDHGNEFTSRYAHLSKINVKLGQIIKRGQEIGASGNTGRSTGPHLHFEVRFKNMPQDPARFLQQGPQLLWSLFVLDIILVLYLYLYIPW